MNFKENNKPIFLQIADRICEDILCGNLIQGERIPSVREYAASVEVNANTVMRSYEYLSQAEIIFNRRGIGFFVADNAAEIILTRRRKEFLDGEVYDFFRQLSLLGITAEDLKQMYQNYLTRKQ